jgi:predicted AlkP superfamily pyrophosphatase or phosphodiesterase
MPRIKALMTGGVPGFVDVLLNAVSSALHEDNLLAQAISAGKKIVFFGDDTWMKLFPGHFTRSDGTTSFFVTDYTEVRIHSHKMYFAVMFFCKNVMIKIDAQKQQEVGMQ